MRRGRGTHIEGLPHHGCWRQRLTYGVLGAPWHFLSWNRKWKWHHHINRGKRSRQIIKQSDSISLGTGHFQQISRTNLVVLWTLFCLDFLCWSFYRCWNVRGHKSFKAAVGSSELLRFMTASSAPSWIKTAPLWLQRNVTVLLNTNHAALCQTEDNRNLGGKK